ELVQERATQATDDRARNVDPQLAEVALRADERPEDVGPDLAGGVEGGTGDRADEDDDPVDDEADDDPGEARRGSPVDRGAEHGEDEDRRSDHLGQEADDGTGVRVDAHGAQAERLGIVAASDHEGQRRADEAADELRADVADRRLAVDLAGRPQGNGDRRIDMAAGDVIHGITRRAYRARARERDRRELRAPERVLAGEEHRERDRARPDEDEDRGADRLGGQLLGERGV